MVRNKFNLLTSKEWLPFQKSWFRYIDYEAFLVENLRFFTKADEWNTYQYVNIPNADQLLPGLSRITGLDLRNTFVEEKLLQFAFIDALSACAKIQNIDDAKALLRQISDEASDIFSQLSDGRFLAIVLPNMLIEGHYYPLAWQLATDLGRIFSLKDEKIACWSQDIKSQSGAAFFYVLYFRKDAKSGLHQSKHFPDAFKNIADAPAILPDQDLPAWFILKPPPRKKDEMLHPAKYPEQLTKLFIDTFTQAGANVFDPMSGTGSTLISAIENNRNAYGVELSPFFAEIARQRINSLKINGEECRLETGDALNSDTMNFPLIDYMITSPPYWDMLNMKGAEYQARRKEKGLQLNYSDDARDIGNINDYQAFVKELSEIYFHIDDKLLKPGAYITIVVKNIKKLGSNYPLAWDLARILCERWQLLPECFWCQDDISIAPYGYGNTWVSNTFHQYCLNFRKPF